MHELSITDQLLSLTLRHAQEVGAVRVTRLNLVIGEFSSVVDDSVQFYWDMLAKGTIAQDAVLHFERVPGRLRCQDCEQELAFNEYGGRCPSCGSSRLKVVDGDQFRLESIEIESE